MLPSLLGLKKYQRFEAALLRFTTDPFVAVANAHVIATDTWISMGMEEEAERRKKDFAGFTVDQKLMDSAAAEAVFLHCLARISRL